MPMLLKNMKNELKKFRPDAPKSYPKLRVTKIESTAAFGIKSVTYKSIVKSEESSKKYITFVRFFDVDFSDKKDEKHQIPSKVRNILKYYGPHKVNKNRVQVKCSCEDFRFAFEYQNSLESALIGRFRKYKRKTPPPTRPSNPTNPNPLGKDFVNPDNHQGYCKHIHSLLLALKNNEKLQER